MRDTTSFVACGCGLRDILTTSSGVIRCRQTASGVRAHRLSRKRNPTRRTHTLLRRLRSQPPDSCQRLSRAGVRIARPQRPSEQITSAHRSKQTRHPTAPASGNRIFTESYFGCGTLWTEETNFSQFASHSKPPMWTSACIAQHVCVTRRTGSTGGTPPLLPRRESRSTTSPQMGLGRLPPPSSQLTRPEPRDPEVKRAAVPPNR